MGNLIERILKFVNLQKAVNISIPGVVLTAGILLWYYSLQPQHMKVDAHEFHKETLDTLGLLPLQRDEACQKLTAMEALTSGADGRLNKTEWMYLGKRRATIEDCILRLRVLVINEQKNVTKHTATVDATQKTASEFAIQSRDYETRRSPLAGHFAGIVTGSRSDATKAQVAVKEAESRIAIYNGLIERLSKDQTTIDERFRTSEAEEWFAAFVTRLTDKTLYIGLLAMALGLLLDPLQRIFQHVFYFDGAIRLLNSQFSDAEPILTNSVRRDVQLRLEKSRIAEGKRRLTKLLMSQYTAVGRGLLTHDDIDALQDRYSLSSQFGLGLIVPVLVLLIGGGLYLDAYLTR